MAWGLDKTTIKNLTWKIIHAFWFWTTKGLFSPLYCLPVNASANCVCCQGRVHLSVQSCNLQLQLLVNFFSPPITFKIWFFYALPQTHSAPESTSQWGEDVLYVQAKDEVCCHGKGCFILSRNRTEWRQNEETVTADVWHEGHSVLITFPLVLYLHLLLMTVCQLVISLHLTVDWQPDHEE